MDAATQLALSMGVPTLAVLTGILINNSRLSDLRAHMGGLPILLSAFRTLRKSFRNGCCASNRSSTPG